MKAILSVALCLFLFNLSSVFSQVSSGAISGTVVDTTGAAIPDQADEPGFRSEFFSRLEQCGFLYGLFLGPRSLYGLSESDFL